MSIHWGGRGAGHVSRWSASVPSVAALALDFLTTTSLDSRITFTRASTATFVGSNGLIQTAAIDAPRFDYDPVTLAPKGLLIEAARTNLALYSNDFTQVNWAKTNITPALTAVGPDGAANSASTLTATAGNGTALQSITSASAARATSCYVKRRTGTGTIEMTQDGGTTWAAVTVTSNWTRVSIASATVTNPSVGFRIVSSGDEIDVWGFQCENGAFSTSVIPTTTTSGPRSVDIATMTGTNFSSWYNQSEGTFVASADTLKPSGVAQTANLNSANDGTSSNAVSLRFGTSGATGLVQTGGSAQTAFAGAAYTANTPVKWGMAYRLNDTALCVAGGAVATDATVTVGLTMTQMNLGARNGGLDPINGHIRSLYYYNERVSDLRLQVLTS